MMASDGEKCEALTEQISSLNCDDSENKPKEVCGITTDENEEIQNKTDNGQEKCPDDENSREVVTETDKPFSDEPIIQFLEYDPEQEDAGQKLFGPEPKEGIRYEIAPASLAAVVEMCYVPGSSNLGGNAEEEDE